MRNQQVQLVLYLNYRINRFPEFRFWSHGSKVGAMAPDFGAMAPDFGAMATKLGTMAPESSHGSQLGSHGSQFRTEWLPLFRASGTTLENTYYKSKCAIQQVKLLNLNKLQFERIYVSDDT